MWSRLPLPVCSEDVILRLHYRMAPEPALGVVAQRLERVGRGVIVELAVSPPAAVREPLAVFHHEIDVVQGVRHRRRSGGLGTFFSIPMDLRHLGAVGEVLTV